MHQTGLAKSCAYSLARNSATALLSLLNHVGQEAHGADQCMLHYADVEFGRLQARDLLQHLWTGPISNAPVNIVQGSKSVEVRPVGISKVHLCFVCCKGMFPD